MTALVTLGAFAGPAWAACDINVVAGGSIQNAIDGAVGGQTICVGAGTFNEQVIIQNKGNLAINLQGAGSGLTIITPKATPSAFPSAGGATKTPMMYIYNSNVNVSGFTLDGGANLPADGNGMDTIGVYFLNANGSLRNSVIKGLRCATWGPCTWGITPVRVSNSASVFPPTVTTQPTRTVTIENNDIFDFQSNGIFLTADEGFSGPGPSGQTANLIAYVRNNRITGSGPQTVAQNGIQIGGILGFEPNSKISGVISGNTIKDFWYTIGTVATDSAILSVAKTTSSGMQITGNTITNAQVGIHSSWSATIRGNTINWTWTTVPPGCRGSAIQLSYYYAVAPDLGPAMTFIVRNNLIYYDNVGIEVNVALAPGYVFEENSLNVYTGWTTPSGAVAIANYTSTAILANNNYWGQASGPLPIECCGPVTVTTHITTPTTTPGPGFWPTVTPTEPVPTLSEWSLMLLGLLLVLTAGWMMPSDRSRRARAER